MADAVKGYVGGVADKALAAKAREKRDDFPVDHAGRSKWMKWPATGTVSNLTSSK